MRHSKDLLHHDRLNILIVDLTFFIGKLFESFEGQLQICFGEPISQILHSLPEGMASREFSQDDRSFRDSHRLRRHDLIGQFFLQDTILMDPGFVGKGIGSHNRLVGLNDHTGNL